MVDPATYNPANGIQFFPHRIAVTESPVADGLPPKASSLQVTDASSDLFDQLSYLWGTLSFKNMMDPDNNSDEPHWAFRTEEGNNLATYTPFNFAVIAGGLREAALVGGHTEAAAIYTRFFKKVANVMQLAEFDPSGETGNDSDGDGIPFLPEQPDQLAPVFAAEAQLDFTVTGIDDRISLNEADVAIYPNPASENATIGFTIEKASNVSVEAVDFTGKKVQTILNRQLPQGQFKASWNVNDLPGGIYFIRITVGASAVLTKKVVVM